MRLPPVVRAGAALALLAALAVAFFWPLLFGGQALVFGDIALYFVPLLAFQRVEVVAHGRLPLWNPHLLCGTPFVGNPQAWPLYPSSLLLYLLPPWRAVGGIGALHVLWASVGAYLFLRSRERGRGAALFGAVVWAYGGAMVSRLQFPNMIQTASWLPWLLLAVGGVIRRPDALRTAALGAVVGLALLGAHAQVFLLEGYLALAWAAFLLWRAPWRGPVTTGPKAALRCLLGGAGLGALAAAGQLLPVGEMLPRAARGDLTLAAANRFILPPYAALTNFVAPNFYGNPALPANPYIGRGNFWEPCCYLGLLPFALAVGAAFFRWRNREVRFWAAAAAVCLWLAMGRDAGLFALAFGALPGLSRFHDAARFLLPGTFALACLASDGFAAMLSAPTPRRRIRQVTPSAIFLLTLADLLPFSASLNPIAPAAAYGRAAAEGSGGIPAGRVWFADASRVWGAFISYRDSAPAHSEAAAFLGSLAPNLGVLRGVDDACGYEPVALAAHAAACAELRQAARNGAMDDRLLDALAVRRIVRWDRYEKAPTLQDRGRRMAASRALLLPDGAGSAPPLPLAVRDETPERVVVTLPAAHPAGRVRLADAAYPGWTAWVDGAPARAEEAGAFRRVAVGQAARRITFRYEPDSWLVGSFFSFAALGILSALLAPTVDKVVRRRTARRGASAAPPVSGPVSWDAAARRISPQETGR